MVKEQHFTFGDHSSFYILLINGINSLIYLSQRLLIIVITCKRCVFWNWRDMYQALKVRGYMWRLTKYLHKTEKHCRADISSALCIWGICKVSKECFIVKIPDRFMMSLFPLIIKCRVQNQIIWLLEKLQRSAERWLYPHDGESQIELCRFYNSLYI